MELLKAMQEMMDAYQAKMLVAIRVSYEKMTARLEAKLDAEGMDPGKLWILEEIGRHPHRVDPPCRSGTAQGTHRQKESD
jgi:hypothetical protein